MKKYCNNIYKLHLELDLSNLMKNDLDEFLKLAKCEGKTISRDVLVPEDITLHKLNYLIQRAFGFSNSHLHQFLLPDDVFKEFLNDDTFNYFVSVGNYFRYPDGDDCLSYWDEDYVDGNSFSTWLKSKYLNSKAFKGTYDTYSYQYDLIRNVTKEYDKKNIIPFFAVKLSEFEHNSFVMCNELCENKKISEILAYNNNFNYYKLLNNCHRNNFQFELLRKPNFNIFEYEPITNLLRYYYDFGDNWEINITISNIYTFNKENDAFTSLIQDNDINIIEDDLHKVIITKPCCVNVDGINVMDDVGGINGLFNFLKTINSGKKEDKEEMLNWSKMWNWKYIVPNKKTLI